jgi:hypothetical protein
MRDRLSPWRECQFPLPGLFDIALEELSRAEGLSLRRFAEPAGRVRLTEP